MTLLAYVRDFLVCARSKAKNRPVVDNLMTVGAKSNRDNLSVDVVRKLPMSKELNMYVVTCMDVFSRYLVTYLIRNVTASTIIKF